MPAEMEETIARYMPDFARTGIWTSIGRKKGETCACAGTWVSSILHLGLDGLLAPPDLLERGMMALGSSTWGPDRRTFHEHQKSWISTTQWPSASGIVFIAVAPGLSSHSEYTWPVTRSMRVQRRGEFPAARDLRSGWDLAGTCP